MHHNWEEGGLWPGGKGTKEAGAQRQCFSPHTLQHSCNRQAHFCCALRKPWPRSTRCPGRSRRLFPLLPHWHAGCCIQRTRGDHVPPLQLQPQSSAPAPNPSTHRQLAVLSSVRQLGAPVRRRGRVGKRPREGRLQIGVRGGISTAWPLCASRGWHAASRKQGGSSTELPTVKRWSNPGQTLQRWANHAAACAARQPPLLLLKRTKTLQPQTC